MKFKDLALALALAATAMILNVAMSFVWVWVYSQVQPGQSEAHYIAYAQQWAPVSSVVFGAPILFLAGFLAGRGREAKAAALIGLIVGLVYVGLDAAIVAASLLTTPGGAPWMAWVWIALSWTTKPLFAWLGGRLGGRRAEA